MNIEEEPLKELIEQLLTFLDVSPDRTGLKDTPGRVVRSYKKILDGYGRTLENEITIFENEYKYDDLVYSGKIDFFSLCEHHLLPFFGIAHIAYVPNEKIIGLSKLARAVDIYAHRLQEQERITMQVAEELDKQLAPKGVIVMLEGQHLCSMARGVEKVNSNMKTIATTGCFKQDAKFYDRFMQILAS